MRIAHLPHLHFLISWIFWFLAHLESLKLRTFYRRTKVNDFFNLPLFFVDRNFSNFNFLGKIPSHKVFFFIVSTWHVWYSMYGYLIFLKFLLHRFLFSPNQRKVICFLTSLSALHCHPPKIWLNWFHSQTKRVYNSRDMYLLYLLPNLKIL